MTPPKSAIQIMLSVEIPKMSSEKQVPKEEKKPLEDKVREALHKIDSGHESHVEWLMIRGLYKQLRCLKKPSTRAKNIMKQIEPVLTKFGYAVDHETGDKK